jgi:hypothetical protein
MIENFLSSQNIDIVQLLFIVIGYLMPIPLSVLALNMWHHYRTERFVAGIKWILLEIQVPRDVVKSPSAMELIFSNAFFQKTSKGFWAQYVQGSTWLWFSLEMVSIDGKIHFYVRTPSRIRDLVETQIYSQYPQAKVLEVEDYAFRVPALSKEAGWNMWGCEFTKSEHDARPLRTYTMIDELKSGTDEEYKIDPITPTIEFLGSLAQGEQIWIQIVVRPSVKAYHSHKTGGHVDITKAAAEEVESIMKPYAGVDSATGESRAPTIAPPILAPLIKEMVRHVSMLHFDCGIRMVVLARKDLVSDERFNSTRMASRMIFRQYAWPSSNELSRTNSPGVGALWGDPTGTAGMKLKNRFLDWYRLRIFFHPPLQYAMDYPKILSAFFPSGKPKIFVLSSEELATIFHFPGMVSETPSFKRIESKIAKPPSNLPF